MDKTFCDLCDTEIRTDDPMFGTKFGIVIGNSHITCDAHYACIQKLFPQNVLDQLIAKMKVAIDRKQKSKTYRPERCMKMSSGGINE